MLTVGIELNCIIVIVLEGILHPRLEPSSKTKVHGQRYHAEAALAAHISRAVRRSIVNDDVINSRRTLRYIIDSGDDVVFFVICGDNG